MTHDAEERVRAYLGGFGVRPDQVIAQSWNSNAVPGERDYHELITTDLRAVLQALADTRQQLDEAEAAVVTYGIADARSTDEADRLRTELARTRSRLDIEQCYSRGLRDTLRRIGALDPVTDEAVRAIIRDGIPAASALALEAKRLNDPGPTRQGHDRAQTAQEARRDDRSAPMGNDATQDATGPQNGATAMPLDEAFDTLRQLPGFTDWRDDDGSGA